jgi:hypothetical protein
MEIANAKDDEIDNFTWFRTMDDFNPDKSYSYRFNEDGTFSPYA